jgi:hypothetical protein
MRHPSDDTRMTRRLLNLLTWLSLLLFLGVAVLAVRSYWAHDVVSFRWNPAAAGPTSGGRVVRCSSFPGEIRLNVVKVIDGDAGFWRSEFGLPRVWSYPAGDKPFVEVGRFPRRRRGSEPAFRWSRLEEAPCDLGGGIAARIVMWNLVVPHWSAMLAAAALPLARAPAACAALRRRRRTAGGRCPRCGYDLTGNISGVCPECGTAPHTTGD